MVKSREQPCCRRSHRIVAARFAEKVEADSVGETATVTETETAGHPGTRVHQHPLLWRPLLLPPQPHLRRRALMAKIKIKWVRSQIGYSEDQRRTIRALGLKRLQQAVEREDSPTIRGMVHKVRHLVAVEEA